MRHFTILFMLTLLSVSMNAADVFRQDSIYERVYQNLFTGSVNVNDPNDYCDLHGLDEGTSNFMRQLFTFEELTSDEAYCSWGDYGISDANANKVSALSPMLYGLWMRIYKGIDLCNYFLEQTATLTDAATLTLTCLCTCDARTLLLSRPRPLRQSTIDNLHHRQRTAGGQRSAIQLSH